MFVEAPDRLLGKRYDRHVAKARLNGRLLAAQRRAAILEALSEREIISLAEIRRISAASEPTIRRDLASLEADGLIARVHGGARLSERDFSLDEEFGLRRRRNARAKRLIAESLAGRIPDGASLLLNDGSTTYAVAQALERRDAHVHVATTALNIAELLAQNPARRVAVIGGVLPHKSFGTLGAETIAAIQNLSADIAILGCDGIHQTEGIRATNIDDAKVARAMSDRAERVTVVADSSKLGNLAPVKILDWTAIDELVADRLPAHTATSLEAVGVEVFVAASAPGRRIRR